MDAVTVRPAGRRLLTPRAEDYLLVVAVPAERIAVGVEHRGGGEPVAVETNL